MTESKATSPRDTLDAVRELNESDPVFSVHGLEFMDYTRAFSYADRVSRKSGERVYVMRIGHGIPLAVCEPQRSIPWVSQ